MLFGEQYYTQTRIVTESGGEHEDLKKPAFFAYQLNQPVRVPKLSVPSWIGTFHTTDLFYLFMTPLMRAESEDHYKLSLDMITAWSNFAKSGSPGLINSRGGQIKWTGAFEGPREDSASRSVGINALVLDANSYHMQSDTLKEVCQVFWKPKIAT